MRLPNRSAVAAMALAVWIAPVWGRQNFTCASCHREQAESQPKTSMARAMELPGTCSILRDHPHLMLHQGRYTWEIVTTDGKTIYTVTDGTESFSVPIGWAVGLGAAGQTYVYERDGRYYESRVSYFDALRGLDLTMGAQHFTPRNIEEAAGRVLPAPEAAECFSCHSTGAVAGGHIHAEALTPGVQCEHCHARASEHLAGMQNGNTAVIPAKLARLSADGISALCGQCHRTWERVAAEGPLSVANVRFQPYRLVNSKCYDGSDARISCIACHDPHQEVVRGAAAYDSKCLACHGATAAAGHAPSCKVAAANCAECHMPKIDLPGAHAKFTDHQIRIVRNNEAYPN